MSCTTLWSNILVLKTFYDNKFSCHILMSSCVNYLLRFAKCILTIAVCLHSVVSHVLPFLKRWPHLVNSLLSTEANECKDNFDIFCSPGSDFPLMASFILQKYSVDQKRNYPVDFKISAISFLCPAWVIRWCIWDMINTNWFVHCFNMCACGVFLFLC